MTPPRHVSGRHPGLVRSTTAAAAAGSTALLLGRTAARWAARDTAAFLTSGDLPVDGLVALLAVSAGAVAAAVLTAGCTLLAGASAARLVGRSVRTTARAARLARAIGRRLDQAGSRLTPLVVRRVLAIGIGAGLGLAGPATIATADEADLGWAVTSTAPAGAPAALPGPTTPERDGATAVSASTPADDGGWAAWPVSSGSTQVVPSRAADPAALPSPGPLVTGVGGTAASTVVAAPAPPGVSTVVAAPAPPTGSTDVAAPAPPGVSTDGATPAPAAASTVADPAPQRADRVVVEPGDSLWSLAAASLGPHASAARIAEAWPRWHAANLALIGADPDLIHPGQALTVPRDDLADAPLEENP